MQSSTELDTPLDSATARIQGHCEFFGRMFELIPAKFYFSSQHGARSSHAGSKYSHNKKRVAPKQAIKEASAKAKKARLDPDAQKSNRERLLHGALEYTDATESAGMDELKQRLQTRMEELRKQRQATAHRKVNGRAAENGKQTRKKVRPGDHGPHTRPEKRAHDIAAHSTGASREAGAIPNSADADLLFAAEPGKASGDRLSRQAKKTDEQLLKQAVAFEQKLGSIDAEQRRSLVEGASWGAMMQRAQGTKVKNDAGLLRKSIKRKEKSKEKSRKGWEKRIEENAKNAKDRAERAEAKKKWVRLCTLRDCNDFAHLWRCEFSVTSTKAKARVRDARQGPGWKVDNFQVELKRWLRCTAGVLFKQPTVCMKLNYLPDSAAPHVRMNPFFRSSAAW